MTFSLVYNVTGDGQIKCKLLTINYHTQDCTISTILSLESNHDNSNLRGKRKRYREFELPGAENKLNDQKKGKTMKLCTSISIHIQCTFYTQNYSKGNENWFELARGSSYRG